MQVQAQFDVWCPSPARSLPLQKSGLSGRALQRVCSFIEAHLQEPLQLTDLAAAAGVSRFHFARMFRLSMGESPMRYLLRARIARAKVLLQRGDRAICDIALGLCFYDQSHFTRSFRRLAGMSPSQFVQQSCSFAMALAAR